MEKEDEVPRRFLSAVENQGVFFYTSLVGRWTELNGQWTQVLKVYYFRPIRVSKLVSEPEAVFDYHCVIIQGILTNSHCALWTVDFG